MTRRSLQVLTGGVLALALVVMGAGFPAKTVPPKEWAKRVCTAVRDLGRRHAGQPARRSARRAPAPGSDFPS